tara:strand:+ start:1987 stop:2220 length:234 start_codon:yes stop_codon:yes gene_type:complete
MSDVSALLAKMLNDYDGFKSECADSLHLDIDFWVPVLDKTKTPVAAIYFNGKHNSLSQDDYEKIRAAIISAVPHHFR